MAEILQIQMIQIICNFSSKFPLSRLSPLSGLERGRHYKVCADMDGLGSLQMVDSLQEAETLHFESEIGPFQLLHQPV